MAHVLTIIPDGYRASNRVQILSCMKNKTGKIQQKLDCAAKVKQRLETDIFESENKLNGK